MNSFEAINIFILKYFFIFLWDALRFREVERDRKLFVITLVLDESCQKLEAKSSSIFQFQLQKKLNKNDETTVPLCCHLWADQLWRLNHENWTDLSQWLACKGSLLIPEQREPHTRCNLLALPKELGCKLAVQVPWNMCQQSNRPIQLLPKGTECLLTDEASLYGWPPIWMDWIR